MQRNRSVSNGNESVIVYSEEISVEGQNCVDIVSVQSMVVDYCTGNCTFNGWNRGMIDFWSLFGPLLMQPHLAKSMII